MKSAYPTQRPMRDYSKPDAVTLFIFEATETHRQFDRLDIPREQAGEKLSISQRAKLAADLLSR